jgi:hypothetical protein
MVRGRISTNFRLSVAACFDSNWMAWFTSPASNTPNPPNCFFVSAYGPSVTDTLLAERNRQRARERRKNLCA